MSTGRLLLFFVRHGETQDNLDRILQGHRDTSLTDNGHRDAEIVGEKLRGENIAAVYHSPLIRMVQTIQPLLKDHSNAVVEADRDLMSQGLGELEGQSYDNIDLGNPRDADGKPGVESFDDFVRRLKRSMGRIIGTHAPQVGQQDRAVVIATHGVCITSIFKTLESTPHCERFNPPLAIRGLKAFEVRYPDSKEVAKLVVPIPATLPVKDGVVDWESISGKPFLIELWGRQDEA